jgi:esterase FrsA
MTQPMPAYRPQPAEDAADYPAYAAAPDRWRSIAGVPAELARRISGFARHGIDPGRIVAAIRDAGPEKGPATPGWPGKMAALGEDLFEQGVAARSAGATQAATRSFLESSFWFFLARFPHIINAAGAAAYRRHNEAYLAAADHFTHPLERIGLAFDGGEMPGLLRMPRDAAAPVPLVLVMGGIDVWKSDLEIHGLTERLLARGAATLAIDIPGTGECPVPMSAALERVALGALAWARTEPRIDARRIGVYGLSFGGHLAAKLALLTPGLAGVVQNGGPIHHAFDPGHVRALPLGTRAALARITGHDPMGDPAPVQATLAGLSLSGQGLLPARTHAPLLSINGARDELVPLSDLMYLGSQGVRHDVLIFAQDRHCASESRDLHEPLAVEWLLRQMAA